LAQHRGMGIYPGNAVANAIVWFSMVLQLQEDVNPHNSVLAYATDIRKSLGRLKDPEFIRTMAADVARIQSRVAWDKNVQDLATAREGCLIVNNTWK
jgi:hypothetical protein